MCRKEYGSEYNLGSSAPFLRARAEAPFENARYYRSGRDAMKALAGLGGRRYGRVLLPALCCESMIIPFELNGVSVDFYRLRPDLSADTEDVLAKLGGADMLVYMRYLGIPAFTDDFLHMLREEYPGLILAEDRTQDIIVPREGGFEPDATIASLRKWAALPEGGLLITRQDAPEGGEDTRFGDMRISCMRDKDRYLERPDDAFKADFMARFHAADSLLDEGAGPAAMSRAYRELLYAIDFRAVYEARRRNIAALRARLEPLAAAGALRFLSAAPESSTLYFPVLLDERDRVWRRMIEEKIYCVVLWPLPERVKGLCAATEYNNRHMLGLICDQRYGEDDMDFIAATLAAAL